ncbi:MAG: CDP-alcohol phosphatidyltransferase family protein, partial [Candidatus Roizmanbacteria bacterium]|nr:CDP-alcohol phosphatidyltransferase family protein [Candidatus Roizmanbacteria bacterium]
LGILSAMLVEEPPLSVEPGSNKSWLREKTDPYWEWATEHIADTIPITADQATLAGLVGVTTGAALRMYSAQHGDKNPWLYIPALTLISGGLLMDSIDGKIAEIRGTKGQGAALDAGVDRINNIVLGATKMILAQQNESQIGEVLAALSTVTGQLPSFARGLAESKGLEVDEGGGSFMNFFGTHLGRSILTGIGLVLPHLLRIPKVASFIDRKLPVSAEFLQNFPYQEIFDALTTGMSTKVAYERYQIYKNPDPNHPKISKEKQDQAQKKIQSYKILMGINIAAMLGTYAGLHQDEFVQVIEQMKQFSSPTSSSASAASAA